MPGPRRAAALRYDAESSGAPTVVAAGSGELADRIIALAREHGVPVREDAPLAQAHARLQLEAQVLHDAEARHLQLGLELGQRAAVTRVEPVEQEAARRVGECLEYAVVVGHCVRAYVTFWSHVNSRAQQEPRDRDRLTQVALRR